MQGPQVHPTHPSLLTPQQQQQHFQQQQQQQIFPKNFNHNDVKKFVDEDAKKQPQSKQQQQHQRVVLTPKDEEDDNKSLTNRTNHKSHSDDDTDAEDSEGQKNKDNKLNNEYMVNKSNNNNNETTSNMESSIGINAKVNKTNTTASKADNKQQRKRSAEVEEENFEFRSDEEVDVSSLEEEEDRLDTCIRSSSDNDDDPSKLNGDLVESDVVGDVDNKNVMKHHKPNKRKRSIGGQMKVPVECEEKKEGEEGEKKEMKKMKEDAEGDDDVGDEDRELSGEIRMQKPLGLLAQHGLTSGSKNHLNNPFFHQQQLHLQQQQQFQQHMQQQQQHRQQLLMQQQQQQKYSSFFNSGNRKHKLFGPEVNSEQFPLLPVKSENTKEQNGAIYPEWTAYDENNKSSNNNNNNTNSNNNKNNKNPDDEGDNGNELSEVEDSNGLVDLSRQILLSDQRFMPSPPPHNFSIPPSSSPTSKSETSGHHWTFEEQFKQLYEMSLDPKRKEFLDDLFSFMQKRGTPVNRIPIMAKQTLDLYELFRLVISKGGLVEVINKKLWREITKGLNLPSSITSAAFTLRTQYMKYLYPYECEKLKLSSLSELQSAIDGNRREGRRPGFDFPNFPPILPPTPSAPHLANLLGPMPLHHNNTPPSSRPPPMHVQDERVRIGAPGLNHPPFLPGHSLQQLQQLHHMGAPFRPFLNEHEARMMHEAAARAMEEMAKRVEESTRQQKHHLQQLQQHHALQQQQQQQQQQQHSSTPEQRRSVLTPQQQSKLFDAELLSQSSVKSSHKNNDDNDGRSSNNSNSSRHSISDNNTTTTTNNNNNNSNKNETTASTDNNNDKKSPFRKQSIKQNFSRIKICSKKDDKGEGKENTLSVCVEMDGVVYEGMLFASASPQ